MTEALEDADWADGNEADWLGYESGLGSAVLVCHQSGARANRCSAEMHWYPTPLAALEADADMAGNCGHHGCRGNHQIVLSSGGRIKTISSRWNPPQPDREQAIEECYGPRRRDDSDLGPPIPWDQIPDADLLPELAIKRGRQCVRWLRARCGATSHVTAVARLVTPEADPNPSETHTTRRRRNARQGPHGRRRSHRLVRTCR